MYKNENTLHSIYYCYHFVPFVYCVKKCLMYPHYCVFPLSLLSLSLFPPLHPTPPPTRPWVGIHLVFPHVVFVTTRTEAQHQHHPSPLLTHSAHSMSEQPLDVSNTISSGKRSGSVCRLSFLSLNPIFPESINQISSS